MLFELKMFVCVCVFRGWLERESRHGLQQGQNWFLISMLWWQQWKDYVKYVSSAEDVYIFKASGYLQDIIILSQFQHSC